MRIGYAVMSAIVQQKSTFLFFVIFVLYHFKREIEYE